MGIAIAICIVTYFAYQYDSTFDLVHENGSSVYRVGAVRDFDNTLTRYGFAPLPLSEITGKTISEVERSTPYLNSYANFKREDELFAANLSYVDPDFFAMFSFDFISGKGSGLTKTTVLISEAMAIRLYGTPEEAFGKTITQVYGNELKEVKIAGVFREPANNSSFFKRNGSSYMHADNYKDEFSNVKADDWREGCTLFVQIADPNRVNSVYSQLQTFTEHNNQVREDFQVKEFTLDPFATIAHRDRDENVQSATWPAPPVAAIMGSVIMGILILLIACFNLTNTAIAISSRRLKEIGIRKVMGSMRMQLIIQFIGETLVICFLGLIVGLAISDFFIEGWNLMTGNNIHLDHSYYGSYGFMGFLCGVLLLTGILAGSYPAFYISKFRPAAILKGKLKFGGTNYFTRTLLGLQFTISLLAIVAAIGFLQNARYQHQYDLGFDVRGSVVAWIADKSEFDTYRNALQGNPEILSVAGARGGIFSNRIHEPVTYESSQVEVDIVEVGDNYLATMDLKLVEGRDFIRDSKTDQQESVIITQKMADLFGWEKPLGKQIVWKDTVKLFVVGVVKDVYTRGLWQEMEPMMMRYVLPDRYNQIVVSAKADHAASVNAFMNAQWNKTFPNRLYNGYLMGSMLEEVKTLGMSIVYGYSFLGAVALLLSATGLYTLLSLNIIKRTKEIGIRKIVGASVSHITRIVNTEFVIILLIASVFGCLAGYNWCNIIMSTIWKYYQGVNVWTFVFSVGLLFTISFSAIAYKILTVVRMNPVDTLKDE